VFTKLLLNRLQSLKARFRTGGTNANQFADEVVDGHQHRGRALQPDLNLRRVGTLHPIRAVRYDGVVVNPEATLVPPPGAGPAGRAHASVGEPVPSRWTAPVPQPRPDLAVVLTPEYQGHGLAQYPAD